jgi:hypothetical protein
MAETNKRLFGPAQLTNVAATKYTPPALTRTLVRHVRVSNPSALPVNFTMSVGADGVATRLYDAFSIAAGAVHDWYPFLMLETADFLQAFGSTTLVLVIEIGGTEYTAG